MSQIPLLYERLADDLTILIEQGVLRPGDRMPSVRKLSSERQISISTVIQAMHSLEDRGLVAARPQSGFFVTGGRGVRHEPMPRVTPDQPLPVDISNRLVNVLKAGASPDVVPLAAALPANSLLPLAALHRLYAGVSRRYPRLLEAASHVDMDLPALTRQLSRRSLLWGGAWAADEFVITNSCTEALNLCLRAVTQPGDIVAVESPAYYLMLQLLETLGLKALEIPTDPRSGMSVEAFDLATRQGKVAACLLVPNGSNPLGCIMPDENKQRIAALAAARGVPIIEDDIYGELYFTEHRPRPVKAFDTSGNVMLCASFSKSLSPSLRVGFVAAGRYRDAIALQKTITSGATNPVTQTVLAEFLDSSAYERHLRGLRRHYQRQVEAMQGAVAKYFPESTRFTRPQAGYVLWVELSESIATADYHRSALQQGVAFVPGELFSASGMYRNCLRLNCGNPYSTDIDAAVRRLGALFRGAESAS